MRTTPQPRIEVNYTVYNDTLYRHHRIVNDELGSSAERMEEIITKEAFIQCYDAWIKNKESIQR